MAAASVLRAHRPDLAPSESDLATSDSTFRCDDATVRQVVVWNRQDASRRITSKPAEKERCRIWGLLCADHLGDSRVADCRPFHLLAFINKQPDVKSDWTRRRWNTTIQGPFNRAERLGLIIKNPFRGLSFPEGDEGRDWTDEEFAIILGAASPAFAELILGIRVCGLRPEEGCDLAWPQIRYENSSIKIDKHKTRYRTKHARCLPLNDLMKELLAAIKARQQQRSGKSVSRIFLSPKGRPWTRSHADSTFRRLRKRLGLPDDLKLHGCRHTFGTQAILNGVDLLIVMQILGHTNPATTKRYVHLANKVDHLQKPMNQAVATVKVPKPKKAEYTPLFDGLE